MVAKKLRVEETKKFSDTHNSRFSFLDPAENSLSSKNSQKKSFVFAKKVLSRINNLKKPLPSIDKGAIQKALDKRKVIYLGKAKQSHANTTNPKHTEAYLQKVWSRLKIIKSLAVALEARIGK